MFQFVLIPVISIAAVWIWQFLNWVWIKPKKTERLFRQQGMKGSSYKLLYGDTKEAELMYQKAYSKPLGLHDCNIPRLMPNILDSVQKYGNMAFIWSGPRPRVFIIETHLIKEMMSNYRTYHKSYKASNHINQMLMTGISAMEGDEWSKARSKINSAFQFDKLKRMVPVIQVCGEHIIEQWKEMTLKYGGCCEIDVTYYMEVFTSSVIAKLMFNSAYTEQIKQTFFQLSELSNLGKLALYSFALPGEKYFPTKRNRRAKEIDNFVRTSFTSMINGRLKKREAGEDSDTTDLLDLLLSELYEDKGLKEKDRQKIIEEVVANCKIFFFGGYETSSNTLSWTMIMLSIHQDWQNRAREEVFQVLGDKKEITLDDLNKLKIVTMIVTEMLRLYPAGIEVSRLVAKDTKLGDYFIPKDTLLTCPTLILHQNKEIWGEDAEKFNPGRFAEGVAKATKGETAYVPFGWGPRICIAQNVSMAEIKLFVAMIIRDFSFDLSPKYVHAPYVDFTVYPQYGAPLILKKL
ncbi:hypothetical protein ACS0TY_027391 [Phlomoides rotata]